MDIPSRMEWNVLNLKQRHEIKQHDPLAKLLFLSGVALLIFSFWYVQADFTRLWSPRTAQLLARIIQDAFPPQWVDLNQLFALSTQTIAMSILAMTFASLGGILLSFLAARRIGKKREAENPLSTSDSWMLSVLKPPLPTRFLLLFTRAVP